MYNTNSYTNYGYGSYSPRFNSNPTYYQPYYNNNNSTFNESVASNQDTSSNYKTVDEVVNEVISEVKEEQKHDTTTQTNEKTEKEGFRFGPVSIGQNRISAFGFSLAIDDLIIIGLALLLFFQDSCDYLFIIILALILFDIKISSLTDFGFLKNLNLFS
ncbi:hypothetical protein D3C76_1217930 [compost metagenome]